jgi:hypothetical protein
VFEYSCDLLHSAVLGAGGPGQGRGREPDRVSARDRDRVQSPGLVLVQRARERKSRSCSTQGHLLPSHPDMFVVYELVLSTCVKIVALFSCPLP